MTQNPARLAAVSLLLLGLSVASASAEPPTLDQAADALATYQRTFEQNVGQFDPRVRFVLRGLSYHAFIQPDAVVYTWFDRVDPDPADPNGRPSWNRDGAIRMTLAGADPAAVVEGVGEGRRVTSYLGLDPNAPAGPRPLDFERVAAREVYEGVDVEYYLRGQQLEHDFIVAPGSDPSAIHLRFDGVDSLKLTPDGDLLLVSGEHTLVQQAPFVYQGSREEPTVVEASYRLAQDGSLRYELGDYDRAHRLVIDPIAWTTYLGGAGFDFPVSIEAGLMGEAIMLVVSNSVVFPLTEEGELVRKGNAGQPDTKVVVVDTGDVGAQLQIAAEFTRAFFGDDVFQDINIARLRRAGWFKCLQKGAAPKGSAATVADHIANGATLLLLAGHGEGIPTIDGQESQGRIDAFIAAVLIPSSRESQASKGGADLLEPEMLSFLRVGGPLNEGVVDLHMVEECKGGENLGFLAGIGGDLTSFTNPPANPLQGNADPFVVAFALDTGVPAGEFKVEYRDHTFAGIQEQSANLIISDLYEDSQGQCVVAGIVKEGFGVDGDYFLTEASYNPSPGMFIAPQPPAEIPVEEGARPQDSVVDEEKLVVGSETPEGLIVELFGRDMAGPLPGPPGESLGSVTLSDDPDRLFKMIQNPNAAKPGELIINVIWGTGTGPTPTPGDGIVPAYGEGEAEMRKAVASCLQIDLGAMNGGLGETLGTKGPESPISLVSETVLGNGDNIVFGVSPGGAFGLAGTTTTEVIGPVDGVEPPAPIQELSEDPGPNDIFAVGGYLEDEWVIVITGPASFRIEPLARGGIGTGFTQGLAPEGQFAFATTVPLTNDLLGTEAVLIDFDGVEWPLGQFYLDPRQTNFEVPPGAAIGPARIEIRAADGSLKVGETLIVDVQPNAFTLGDGRGIAFLIRVAADGMRTDTDSIATEAIELAPGDALFVSQLVTGTLNGTDFHVFCDEQEMALLAAAPAPGLIGVGQVAFEVDVDSSKGTGVQRQSCWMEVDGIRSNTFDVQYNLVQ